MNEETKDTRMLPVQCNCAWNPDRHADSCPVNLRDRLTDAQARLADKDARIAELERQAAMDSGLARLAINAAKDQLASAEAALDKAQALNVELRSQLQSAPAEPWIPVSERLPDIAQEVIVHAQFDGVCAGVLDSYGEWFAPSSDYKLTRVNSWMPLPAAPATADSDVRESME